MKTGEKKTITESCYTVGWLTWDPKEESFDFESCGTRWLEADPTPEAVKMILDFVRMKTKVLSVGNDGLIQDLMWIPLNRRRDAFACPCCDAVVWKQARYCPDCGRRIYINTRDDGGPDQ